jgi:hypothetical protein
MRKSIANLLAICALALAVVQVFADDVSPPATRGQAGTTYGLWNFSTSTTSPAPDSFINPNGTPVLTITPSADQSGIGWQDSLPAVYGSKQGFWDLGDDGHIDLSLPTPGPGTTTETLQLQITYWLSIDQAPQVTISPSATLQSSQNTLVLTGPHGLGSWYTEVLDYSISPNPANNEVRISGDPTSGSVIDQVIVDSLTVPEPSGISIAAVTVVAGVGARRLLRRKQ